MVAINLINPTKPQYQLLSLHIVHVVRLSYTNYVYVGIK